MDIFLEPHINCLFLTARHLFEDLISLDQQLSKTHATQLFRVHSIQGGRQIRGRFLRNITFVLWRDKRQYGRLCSLSMQTFIKHTDLLCGWTIVSPDISSSSFLFSVLEEVKSISCNDTLPIPEGISHWQGTSFGFEHSNSSLNSKEDSPNMRANPCKSCQTVAMTCKDISVSFHSQPGF